MMRLFASCLAAHLLLTSVPHIALAQSNPWQALVALRQEISDLSAERGRLVLQLESAAHRIATRKANPAATPDGSPAQETLPAEMAGAQALARRLASLESTLSQKRSTLVKHADEMLLQVKDETKRTTLLAWRTEATAVPAHKPSLAGVLQIREHVSDGPEELRQKADLLKDAQEKVLVELKQLTRKRELLGRRATLVRSMHALESTPFVEDARSRLTALRSDTSLSGGPFRPAQNAQAPSRNVAESGDFASGGAAAPTAGPTAPTPPVAPPSVPTSPQPAPSPPTAQPTTTMPTPAPSVGTAPASKGGALETPTSNAAQGVGTESLAIKDLLDENTLAELRQPRDSTAYLRALERAQKQLQSIADDLDKRSRMLRQRADELLHTP